MEELHPILVSLLKAAPILNSMRKNGYMVGITDREKSLIFIPNDIIKINIEKDTVLPKDDPMLEVMKTGKPLEVKVSSELYGVPFKAYYTPIRDEDSHIIGGLALGQELEVEEKLIDFTSALSEAMECITQSINKIAEGSTMQEDISENMVQTVKDTVEKYKETDNIISYIKTVSNNTKLLSLNSRIEAARIGSIGKGFAVIADEVRKLGENSAISANNISTILAEIREYNSLVNDLAHKNNLINQEQANAIENIFAQIQELNSNIEKLKSMATSL